MSGHIRKRGERSWELKFDFGTDPLTGKQITKYRSVKGTKREAQVELTRLVNSANQGDYIDPSKTTLSAYLDRWERDWAAINVSPKTLERYGDLLRIHVRRHLGAVTIRNCRRPTLPNFIQNCCARGLAAITVSRAGRSGMCIVSCIKPCALL